MRTCYRQLILSGAIAAFITLAAQSNAQESTSTLTEEAGSEHSLAESTSTTSRMTEPGNISIVLANQPLDRVLHVIAQKTTYTVLARGRTSHLKVPSYVVRDVPLKDALNRLVSSVPGTLLYEPSDQPNTYEVWDQESFRAEILPGLTQEKIFVPKHVSPEELARALEGLKSKGVGQISFDIRSGKVFAKDLPPTLEMMQHILEEIDVGLDLHVFRVEYADVRFLANVLDSVKSEAAPRAIEDDRTRQIIVKDRPQKLAEMKKLVEILDVESRSAKGESETGRPLE